MKKNKYRTVSNNILIFKTDINNEKRIGKIHTIFSNKHSILKWTIDYEDIDNVLRIEAIQNLKEKDVVSLLTSKNVYCEVLND